MFLKNYTSSATVSKTVQKIEEVLVRCGVSGITKEYGEHIADVTAISFQIETPDGKLTIRLPVDKARALEALWLDYVDGDTLNKTGDAVSLYGSRKRKKRNDFKDQAARTAWKIVQDWVEVQMSMIQMKQADTLQVFLPYVFDGRKTYYQALQESKFAGLLPEKTNG